MIETLPVSDERFDAALDQFAVIDETLTPKSDLNRELEAKEILDRYAFTAFAEALRSDEFEESPFDTAADLELAQDFDSEDDAWEAVKAFYASRGCLLLLVGDTEEFIVGPEIAARLGLIGA